MYLLFEFKFQDYNPNKRFSSAQETNNDNNIHFYSEDEHDTDDENRVNMKNLALGQCIMKSNNNAQIIDGKKCYFLNTEAYVTEIKANNWIVIIYDPVSSDRLKQIATEQQNSIKWRQNWSKKPHWGVNIPDNHLSYILSNDLNYFNAYVSGYGKPHEGQAICIPAQEFNKQHVTHRSVQQTMDDFITTATKHFDNSNKLFVSNSLNGNLYRISSDGKKKDSLHYHQDGNAPEEAPFAVLSWGVMSKLMIKDKDSNTEWEIPCGKFATTSCNLCIFIGQEWHKGKTLWHGKEIVGKLTQSNYAVSLTCRKMKPKQIDGTMYLM